MTQQRREITDEEALLRATSIEPALQLDTGDEVQWSEEADVVVVGFGGAGAAAALQAREMGGSVIAIDRFDGGGATAYSGGVYYATETRFQREAGISDSAVEMRKYLAAEGVPVTESTLRRFCEDSARNFEWVNRHVPYSSSLYSGKASYPPEGQFLFYCGNEKSPAFASRAKPAPRGHRAVGSGFTGRVFYTGLKKAALDSGVRFLSQAPVRRIVVNRSGSVIGVEVSVLSPGLLTEHQSFYDRLNPQVPLAGNRPDRAIEACRSLEARAGVRKLVRARLGVVLATGGFVYNLELLKRFRPDLAQVHTQIMRLGSIGCDGSGMALGAAVGGYVDLMKSCFVGKAISPPEAYLHGVLVNRQGRRFINEDAYTGVVGGAIAQQSDRGTAYLVMDSHTFWEAIRNALTMGRGMFSFWGLPALLNAFLGGTRRGRNLKRLALKIKVDPEALNETIGKYNSNIDSSKADEFGKLSSHCVRLRQGPYYALNMSTHNKFGMTPVFTLGGLRVEESTGRVIRRDGNPVTGLYAAGRTAVGMCSAGYVSGMSLADLVFSGRRAALHAMEGYRPSELRKTR